MISGGEMKKYGQNMENVSVDMSKVGGANLKIAVLFIRKLYTGLTLDF